MGSVTFHPFVDLNRIQQDVQATQRAVETRPITFKARDKIFHKLTENLRIISAFQKNTAADPVFQAQFRTLRDNVVWLFGETQSRALSQAVEDIAGKARELNTIIEQGDKKRIAQKAPRLLKDINVLTSQYAPGRQERKKLALARATYQRANSYLERGRLGKNAPSLPFQLNILEVVSPVDDDEIDEELISEICETARSFFEVKTKEGIQRFNQLSGKAKLLVRAHLAKLGIAEGDLLEDRTKTAQALLATAYDIADSNDGQSYLSPSEMDNFFGKIL